MWCEENNLTPLKRRSFSESVIANQSKYNLCLLYTSNDMAILQAAADDWKEKWEHWTQYCFEQHYAYVNPILIIQVLNGTGGKLTDTCLLYTSEDGRVGFDFG